MQLAVGLGASLGNRLATLERTLHRLHAAPGWSLLRVSRWYRSPPMPGGTAAGWFLNGVALFEVDENPEAALVRCRRLEAEAGRRRDRHWADRPLDLDLLWWQGGTVASETLALPHPGIARRAFVYWPLAEVLPGPEADWRASCDAVPPPHAAWPIAAFAWTRPTP
jgi:2-amino-4-hydroxy-6-hydroxymethyldihydropteridine diphosphokinase